MDGVLQQLSLGLPAHAASVPKVRHAVRDWLVQVGRDEVSDEIELAVTEVVTNALVHAATHIEIEAMLHRDTIRVEVADGSPHFPLRRGATSASGTGRGLSMLDQVATRWGTSPRSDDQAGKVVWFELGGSLGDGPGARPSAGLSFPGADFNQLGGADVVTIALKNVPLLLLAAWLEHTSSLIREHLLVQLDGDDFQTALIRHAAAGEAMAVLEEQWPERLLPRDLDELLATSVEPAVTAAHLDLVLPYQAIESFSTFGEVIEEALVLADKGVLLTAPTQPEVRSMRRWLVSEVVEQAAGRAPNPHVFQMWSPHEARPELPWDSSVVDAADCIRLATDDANCILAASTPALKFLGHDPTLVGRRLLTIIPPRFHQAHLAGFSLHLVNGRAPLIGVPIVVPFLCADGEEKMAELLISADHLRNGRSVYIADLRPR